MLICCHFSPRVKSVSSQTYLQAISAISVAQGTLWHHCDRKSFSISPSTGKLPSFLNGCKQIAAKQNSGHWAFSQCVLLRSMSSPASLLWDILVMSPVFHIHKTWTICCSQHILYVIITYWDIISSGMSPDIVLLTGQRDKRIKVSLVRENPWLNFQISKISRTHWKSRKKAVPILLTLTGYLLTVDHQHSAQTLRTLFCSGNWWNLPEKRQHIVGSYTVVIFYDFPSV